MAEFPARPPPAPDQTPLQCHHCGGAARFHQAEVADFGGGLFHFALGKGLTTCDHFPAAVAFSAAGAQLAAPVTSNGIWTSAGAAGGLTPRIVYHFQLVRINPAGPGLSGDLTFTPLST